MIEKDITEAVLLRNTTVKITTIETVKSRTEDSGYEITLQIMAQSTYADWLYETTLYYTKYDQGWMLDRVGWTSESFEQVRIPEIDAMVSYASEYLPLHEVDDKFDHILPIQNPTMDFFYDVNLDKDIINFNWVTTYSELHSKNMLQYTSKWQYDAYSDKWELASTDNHYCIDYVHLERLRDFSLDFSGEWHAERNSPYVTIGAFDTIVISNFTWDAFDVYAPGLEVYANIDPHFTRIKTSDALAALGDVKFANTDGDYIEFSAGSNGTSIQLYLSDGRIAAVAMVTCELPSLP